MASVMIACLASPSGHAADTPPIWAFPVLDPSVKGPADDGVRQSLPGSEAHFTAFEMTDTFLAHDWFPSEHPVPPAAVAQGRKPDQRACGMCHYPNGQGRPENASLAGLPADYIVRQVEDMKAGRRTSSAPSTRPQALMHSTAVAVSAAELAEAAAYFASLDYKPWIRVVESETAPRAMVGFGTMWTPDPAGGVEPLGRRIVELPEDPERTKLRDPHSGFVAYVPVGSVERGRRIAQEGVEGRVPACVSCHGADLGGQAPAPPLAGRSATYIVRQLYDLRAGLRDGENAQLMRPAVANLGLDDMIDLAAYAASLKP